MAMCMHDWGNSRTGMRNSSCEQDRPFRVGCGVCECAHRQWSGESLDSSGAAVIAQFPEKPQSGLSGHGVT